MLEFIQVKDGKVHIYVDKCHEARVDYQKLRVWKERNETDELRGIECLEVIPRDDYSF